ncbi:MAG: hypothetical protein K2H76_01030, partial [Muribaculaceae bacterium]|nr:hypothetical protein [Muribaculaceae bacterium]
QVCYKTGPSPPWRVVFLLYGDQPHSPCVEWLVSGESRLRLPVIRDIGRKANAYEGCIRYVHAAGPRPDGPLPARPYPAFRKSMMRIVNRPRQA